MNIWRDFSVGQFCREGVGEIGYLPVVEKQAFAEGENVRNRRCLRSEATKLSDGRVGFMLFVLIPNISKDRDKGIC